MAEGILNKLGKEKSFEADSAGIYAMEGFGASPKAIKAMGAIDIDISNHVSKAIRDYSLEDYDLILTMSSSHKDSLIYAYPEVEDKIFMLNEYAFGEKRDIEDPYGGEYEDYVRARDEIYEAVVQLLD